MKIDVDLPKFDIPKDFIVGDGIMGDILNMYGLFPCKIKAGVFAFCTRGTIRVTINLDEHTARANDFITLLPNTFIQIHEVSEDAEVFFFPFSGKHQFYPDDLQLDCYDHRESGSPFVR